MAAAARATADTKEADIARVASLRNNLADSLLEISDTFETGVHSNDDGSIDRTNKVAGSCHLCFADIESEAFSFY